MGRWQSVFKSELLHQAEIVKAILEDHDLSPILINKKVSMHVPLGLYEIQVAPEEVLDALKTIEHEVRFK